MYHLCAMGEVLIDFTACGVSENGNVRFERNPGGAPANVAAVLAKLGLRSAVLSMVGDDMFGRFLRETIGSCGVEIKGIRLSKEYRTTLAFVQLSETGDRSFSFYRNPGADMMISPEDVDYELIGQSQIFHFGSLSLTNEPANTATFRAVQFAKNHGKIVSFDPNLRPPLWDDLNHAREEINKGFLVADVVKISEEELAFATGRDTLEEGTEQLMQYGPSLILVTMGPNGCFYKNAYASGLLPTYDTQVVDTTGAGDAFQGAFLYKFCESGKTLRELRKGDIEEMVDFANAAGATVAARKGGLTAVPTREEVETCQKAVAKLQSKACLSQ